MSRSTVITACLTSLDVRLRAAAQISGMRIFALIDGALMRDMPVGTQRAWASIDSHSLLTGAPKSVAAAGPLLYSLGAERHERHLPATLCDGQSGRVAGSFILSDKEPAELVRTLSDFVEVRLSDGADMVMRFFDPRVLPIWLEHLTPGRRHQIADTVVEWIWLTHDFQVQKMRFKRVGEAVLREERPMSLPLDVENALIDACFPFTMIERMRAEDAATLERVAVPMRYSFFRKQLERARAHGITAQGELEAYCSTAIEYGAAFDEDPRVSESLTSIARGATFDEALAQITMEEWQRVRARQ